MTTDRRGFLTALLIAPFVRPTTAPMAPSVGKTLQEFYYRTPEGAIKRYRKLGSAWRWEQVPPEDVPHYDARPFGTKWQPMRDNLSLGGGT